jgi:hypothetical protein
MKLTLWVKRLIPVMFVLLLLVTACSATPSKYEQVQKDTTGFGAPAAVDKQAEQGAKFNRFFPVSEGAYEVIPAQEKKGFAEYKLKKEGETVAMLSISDTLSLPAAAAKYADATENLGGYPMVQQGNTGTGILVNNRYQVKVLSRDPAFSAADRAAWIQKFDLQGLSQLAATSKGRQRAAKKLAPVTIPEAPAATRPTPAPAPQATPQPDATPPQVPEVLVPQPVA